MVFTLFMHSIGGSDRVDAEHKLYSKLTHQHDSTLLQPKFVSFSSLSDSWITAC